MRNPVAAALAAALTIGSALLAPLTEYNEEASVTRRRHGPRNPFGKYMRRYNRRYNSPHQGAQEIARRKRQIKAGTLKVSAQ